MSPSVGEDRSLTAFYKQLARNSTSMKLHRILLPTLLASLFAASGAHAQNDECADVDGTPREEIVMAIAPNKANLAVRVVSGGPVRTCLTASYGATASGGRNVRNKANFPEQAGTWRPER